MTGFKDTFFYTKKTSVSKGRLLDWSVPRVMGIVNVTPDSFYDGSATQTLEDILQKAGEMVLQGADILDIGGYSSRPGAEDISVSEEISRVIPVIQHLKKEQPHVVLSIDTFRAEVAASAIEAGAGIINDISGGMGDPDMFRVAASHQVPYILMHMKGSPQTMTQETDYADFLNDILGYFTERIALARQAGIRDIILDPGFGFAKNAGQNYELFQKMDILRIFHLPVLIGVSRKSMIYRTLESSPDEALNGTTVLNAIALMNGIQILRVHDVKEAREAVKLITTINYRR